MVWVWPLWAGPAALPDPPGRFGFRRKYDVHTGVDLYTYPGMPVLAVEGGTVVAIERFTGPSAGTPWWHDTDAVLVEGPSGVVCYGEISPLKEVQVGATLVAGDCIGCVKTVLRKNKGRPMTMLHFEWYRHGTRQTVVWDLDQACPENLLDPTDFLERALRGVLSPHV